MGINRSERNKPFLIKSPNTVRKTLKRDFQFTRRGKPYIGLKNSVFISLPTLF